MGMASVFKDFKIDPKGVKRYYHGALPGCTCTSAHLDHYAIYIECNNGEVETIGSYGVNSCVSLSQSLIAHTKTRHERRVVPGLPQPKNKVKGPVKRREHWNR